MAASYNDSLSMFTLLAGDSSVSRIMLRFTLSSNETIEDFEAWVLKKAAVAFPNSKVKLLVVFSNDVA